MKRRESIVQNCFENLAWADGYTSSNVSPNELGSKRARRSYKPFVQINFFYFCLIVYGLIMLVECSESYTRELTSRNFLKYIMPLSSLLNIDLRRLTLEAAYGKTFRLQGPLSDKVYRLMQKRQMSKFVLSFPFLGNIMK